MGRESTVLWLNERCTKKLVKLNGIDRMFTAL